MPVECVQQRCDLIRKNLELLKRQNKVDYVIYFPVFMHKPCIFCTICGFCSEIVVRSQHKYLLENARKYSRLRLYYIWCKTLQILHNVQILHESDVTVKEYALSCCISDICNDGRDERQ